MNQIRIILESEDKSIGYIITPKTQRCEAGKFDEGCKVLLEKSQEGLIDNPEELCRQIYFVLLASIKEKR